MDPASFWKIIDASRKDSDGDLDAQQEALVSRLEELEPEEIVAFDHLFRTYWAAAYTWDVWGAAYVIGGGCSDDAFMDFRGWLISRGQKAYEGALKDPETLVRVAPEEGEETQFEGFQYAASMAWENKTGGTMDDFPGKAVEHPSEPLGTPWSDENDDLERRFPKLWKKYS